MGWHSRIERLVAEWRDKASQRWNRTVEENAPHSHSGHKQVGALRSRQKRCRARILVFLATRHLLGFRQEGGERFLIACGETFTAAGAYAFRAVTF